MTTTEQWAGAFAQGHSHQGIGGVHSHSMEPYQQQALSQLHQAALEPYLQQALAQRLPTQVITGAERSFDVFEAEFKAIRDALKEFGIDRGVLEELLKEVRSMRAELRDALSAPKASATQVTEHFPARALRWSV